jgi:hypothetical protein
MKYLAAAIGLLIAAQAMAQSTSLEITRASWGYAGERKDVKADLEKLCNGKPACSFMVDNGLSAADPKDPSPGHRKGLILTWKCGGADFRDQFPEGKPAELKCP